MKSLKTIGIWCIYIICILIVCIGVKSCVEYDYGRYQRKFPNTHVGDYIWDKIF